MKSIVTFVFLLIIFSTQAFAQQIRHQPEPAFELGKTVELEFSVPGLASSMILDATLFYRYSGEIGYRQDTANTQDGRILYEFTPSNSSATEVEYFLRFETTDGMTLTYPENSPEENPVRVSIINGQDNTTTPSQIISGIDYNIMLPEPDTRINPADFMIIVSFYYDDDTDLDYTYTLLLNGEDVSEQATITPYMISYIPETQLEGGLVNIQVIAQKDGRAQELVSWDAVITERARREPLDIATGEQRQQNLVPTGQFEVSARSQSFSGNQDEIGRVSFRASGRNEAIRYSVNGLFTTQEDARLQPQNRFGAELYVGNWLELQAGHVYPSLNPFLISGRRIYGLNSGINLLEDNIQMRFIYGQLSRSIRPLYGDLRVETNTLNDSNGNPLIDANGNPIEETSFVLPTQSNGFGTYQRNVAGFRLGLGSGRIFGWSLSALRVEDDINSINVIRNFEDLTSAQFNNLTPEQQAELQNNPNLLQINSGASSPQGNLALATDFSLRLDQGRIQLRTDLAGSLLNNDITDGVFTNERANDLGYDLGDDVLDIFDRLSWLIVINENMSSLPLQINDGEADAFVPTGIFAQNTLLNLNYFNHNLSVQYRWIGPDFVSLGNTSQRRDIAGYTITDRFRALRNVLHFTLSHEVLTDNVVNNRDATTTSMTNRANVSWFPVSRDLPRISVGVRHRTRDNSVGRENPFLPADLLNRSVRNVRTNNQGELVSLPSPRDNSTLQLTASITQMIELFEQDHELSLNYSNINTTDQVFAYGDFKSQSVGFQVRTQYRMLGLRTHAGFNYLTTEALSGLSEVDVTGFNLGGEYALLRNQLTLNLDFAFTQNSSKSVPLTAERFDPDNNANLTQEEQAFLLFYAPDTNPQSLSQSDNNAFIISGGGRYDINRNHSIYLLFNYTSLNDSATSFNLPNDHLVQVRYITRF